MASKSEYILKVHITATAEKAEGVLDVIVWMLTSPRPDDPSPKGFGMPGVTFEGAFMEEVAVKHKMSDLTERLRHAADCQWKDVVDDCQEAADEIERLRGHYERIKAQTCLCRFDKGAGEGESGSAPHTECEYHKAMRAEIERLEGLIVDYEYIGELERKNAKLEAVVDAAKEFKEWWHEDMRGSVSYDKLCAALAALEEADDE